MSIVNAVVLVFAMFFLVVFTAVLSHHKLEIARLVAGYYKDEEGDDNVVEPQTEA